MCPFHRLLNFSLKLMPARKTDCVPSFHFSCHDRAGLCKKPPVQHLPCGRPTNAIFKIALAISFAFVLVRCALRRDIVRFIVTLLRAVGELPTASLAYQARVYCGN